MSLDRDAIRLNGHDVDHHHDGAERRDRAADAFEDSMDYLREQAATGA